MAFHLIFLAVISMNHAFSRADDRKQFINNQMNNIEKSPIFKPAASSCVDYLKSGYKDNGFYTIGDGSRHYAAFCDFASEPGTAWTLAMSNSLENTKKLSQFRKIPLFKNAPVNDYVPNWYSYRMSKQQMDKLANASTHFRYTCSEYGEFRGNNNFKDYLRGAINGLNPLTFVGYGSCASVEYINIRGIPCANCRVPFRQRDKYWIFHHDSSSKGCGFNAMSGSVRWEDNFGLYATVNPKFTCSKHPTSTTNFWFGARR